jgi:hypothetical protein
MPRKPDLPPGFRFGKILKEWDMSESPVVAARLFPRRRVAFHEFQLRESGL